MKQTYYFQHDYNATEDPKMTYLLSKCGLQGIGLYWVIIELLHQQDSGKIKIKFLESLSFKYNINITDFNNVISFILDAELLEKDNEFIFSKRVLRNKEDFKNYKENKSKAGKIGMEKRWNIKEKNNSVITNDNNVITKDNKIKENKIKENIIITSEEVVEKKITNLQELREKMGLPKQVRKVNLWQDEAANAIKYFQDIQGKESSVFKCFKDNEQKAKTALSDCKELGKNNVLYFLKVYNELIKKQYEK